MQHSCLFLFVVCDTEVDLVKRHILYVFAKQCYCIEEGKGSRRQISYSLFFRYQMFQQRIRGFLVGPREGMPESGVLTVSELVEVDHVQCQKIFVLERKSHIVKTGIIRADRDIDASPFTSIKNGFER